MNWTWYLFGFKGRINRAKYWLAALLMLALMILFAPLAIASGIVGKADEVYFGFDIATRVGAKANEVSFGFDPDDIFRLLDPATWRAMALADLPLLAVKTAGTALFFWVFLATSIKRLHDRDRSGWWMVPFFVIPGLYQQFAKHLPDSYLALPLALVVLALCVWGFVELYFLSGSRKTNRFGPNPLLPEGRAALGAAQRNRNGAAQG